MPVLSPFNGGSGLRPRRRGFLCWLPHRWLRVRKVRRRLCPRPRFQQSRRHGFFWIPAIILLRNGPSPEGADSQQKTRRKHQVWAFVTTTTT